MLVLSRREGQQIHIGDDIVLTVIQIEGSRVGLGISAPRDIPVHRSEIMDRINERLKVATEAACGGEDDVVELDGTHESEEGEW